MESPGHGYWCEHCNEWFPVDHYTEMTADGGGDHKHGIEFGIFGRCLAAMDLVAEAAKAGATDEAWMGRARALYDPEVAAELAAGREPVTAADVAEMAADDADGRAKMGDDW